MTTWTARSTRELREISAVIHDAYFEFDDVSHDPVARELSVPFAQQWDWPPLNSDPAWREAPRPALISKTWRYTEERVPFMRGALRVRAVQSVVLDPEAGDAAMLLGVEYDQTSRRLTIDGVSGNLAAVVERLQVTAELWPDDIALYVRRRRGPVGESETPLWDD